VGLLHHAVQVLALTKPASAADGSFALQVLNRTRISRILIYIDDAWHRVALI
jgi:hypothetical protein